MSDSGFCNYETRTCAMWLSTDYGLYAAVMDAASRMKNTSQLAEFIEELIQGCRPNIETSMYSDMLTASMGRINYSEVADVFLDGIETEEDQEEANG